MTKMIIMKMMMLMMHSVNIVDSGGHNGDPHRFLLNDCTVAQ